ncbi:hypothetical protein V6N11_023444 [Hibiscus sabdariffa]|uniref:Uncharacterized protein n=1 Tax=Hibiscus sabdariffa TaxID=183260 RepID=A0ABR2TMQ0_9ROSI
MFKRAGCYGPWLRASPKWRNGSSSSQSPMHRGVQIGIDKIPGSSRGKDVQLSPSRVKKGPVMANEEIEEITITKTSDKEIIKNEEIKDNADPISPPNLSNFGFEPNLINEKYTAMFSRGDTDMFLSCNVDNLNLESIKIPDTSQDLQVISSRKRKALADISDEDMFSANKRREVLEAVNEGIVQISPGNWGDVGISNDQFVRRLFMNDPGLAAGGCVGEFGDHSFGFVCIFLL